MYGRGLREEGGGGSGGVRTRKGRRPPRRRGQGVNICFIATALHPGNGLILMSARTPHRESDTQTPPKRLIAGVYLHMFVLKGHGVYIRSNASPLNTEMIHALTAAHVRSSCALLLSLAASLYTNGEMTEIISLGRRTPRLTGVPSL